MSVPVFVLPCALNCPQLFRVYLIVLPITCPWVNTLYTLCVIVFAESLSMIVKRQWPCNVICHSSWCPQQVLSPFIFNKMSCYNSSLPMRPLINTWQSVFNQSFMGVSKDGGKGALSWSLRNVKVSFTEKTCNTCSFWNTNGHSGLHMYAVH